MLRFFGSYIIIISSTEEEKMAVIYVALIVKGKRKYSQVPNRIRDQVKQFLIDLELENLIDESVEK